MKIEITKNELYITNITRIIKSFINRSYLHKTKGRQYDGFIFITGGECKYVFDDGESFTAKEGDLLYLAKDSIYDMHISCDRYSFVFCDFVFLGDGPRRSAVYTLKDIGEIKIIFDKILLAHTSRRPEWQCDCLSLIYRIYSKLIKLKNSYASSTSREIAERAQAYFLSNIASPNLSVADAARELNISETHLRRIFSSVFTKSPIKYINDERILKAKELMKYNHISLADIAELCGFSSLPYFSKIFKSICATTPAEYRKRLKKDDLF